MFFLNEAITSDWDILQYIISSPAQFQHKPALSHIKGHQDAQASYAQLLLLAQLHIDANCLTLRYRAPQDLQFNIIPAITGCNVNVSIMGNTITSNFTLELQQAALLASLEKYFSDKYNWSAPIYNNINWTAHYASIRKSSLPHKFIIEFINGWLPIGNMMHRYQTKYEAKCLSCLHNPEDINHFIQFPTYQEWKRSLYARLTQYFTKTSTQPALADLLQECLRQRLHTLRLLYTYMAMWHHPNHLGTCTPKLDFSK